MRITQPARQTVLEIDAKPAWPALVFRTDASGPHVWRWTIGWRRFGKSGRATTAGPQWDAAEAIADRGGLLVVRASAGGHQASAAVKITGRNPSEGQIKDYLSGQADADVMLKIVRQESRLRQFTARGEPLRSFDNGYGLCQITNPAPSYEQVFNWRRNVDAGLKLFAVKRAKAIEWLSRDKRSYTAAQLDLETVSRWNGGHYHEWDAKAGAWVRRRDVLCASGTGNIGWDLTDPANAGQTEAALHKRDSGGFNAHTDASSWNYYGACYADHVLG